MSSFSLLIRLCWPNQDMLLSFRRLYSLTLLHFFPNRCSSTWRDSTSWSTRCSDSRRTAASSQPTSLKGNNTQAVLIKQRQCCAAVSKSLDSLSNWWIRTSWSLRQEPSYLKDKTMKKEIVWEQLVRTWLKSFWLQLSSSANWALTLLRSSVHFLARLCLSQSQISFLLKTFLQVGDSNAMSQTSY